MTINTSSIRYDLLIFSITSDYSALVASPYFSIAREKSSVWHQYFFSISIDLFSMTMKYIVDVTNVCFRSIVIASRASMANCLYPIQQVELFHIFPNVNWIIKQQLKQIIKVLQCCTRGFGHKDTIENN